MAYQYLDVEEHGRVLVLRMNDPASRNSMRPEMMDAMMKEIARFEKSTELRCLVLTGADPAFCSGAYVRGQVRNIDEGEKKAKEPEQTAVLPWGDMDARAGFRATEVSSVEGPGIFTVLMHLQKPTIAAINGYAGGGGGGIALACDIRIASEKGSLADVFIQRGGVPGDGSTWLLPRMIGMSNTYLHCYTGDKCDAEKALRWGMVSEVVPPEKLMERTLELATRLANGPVYQMGLIKYLILQGMTQNFDDHLRMGTAARLTAQKTNDFKEGMRSFLEKRPPNFLGR